MFLVQLFCVVIPVKSESSTNEAKTPRSEYVESDLGRREEKVSILVSSAQSNQARDSTLMFVYSISTHGDELTNYVTKWSSLTPMPVIVDQFQLQSPSPLEKNTRETESDQACCCRNNRPCPKMKVLEIGMVEVVYGYFTHSATCSSSLGVAMAFAASCLLITVLCCTTNAWLQIAIIWNTICSQEVFSYPAQ